MIDDELTEEQMLRNRADALEQMDEASKTPPKLPPPRLLESVTEEEKTPPPLLIEGALYCGGKMILGAPSKARKTWALLHLAACIAGGSEWLGLPCRRHNVLFLDAELLPFETPCRLDKIMKACELWDKSGIHLWNLRGHALTMDLVLEEVRDYCAKHSIGAIFIDPYYRLSVCNENDAAEVAAFLQKVERLAHETGAAVILAHHFAKGPAGEKAAIDRMSGSGSFARDPDALMVLTEAEDSTVEEPLFVAELTLRSFPPVQPFTIKWEYPIWIKDNREPTIKGKRGRDAGYNVRDLLRMLSATTKKPIGTKQLQQLCSDDLGMSKRTFYRLFKMAKEGGQIEESDEGLRVVGT